MEKFTCIDAFKNVYLETVNGKTKIGPCCISKSVEVSQLDFANDEYLTSVRNDFTHGVFPSACRACKEDELIGKQSRRQGINGWYLDNQIFDEEVKLVKVDYSVGNLCNLRCVNCGPNLSTSWQKELGISVKDNAEVSKVWRDIDWSELRMIHFTGGEPLLHLGHVEFLRSIVDKSKVRLHYNTNGTVMPSESLLVLWAEFDLVQLELSIDDIGPRFEYLRYPAKWDRVISNMFKLRDVCPVNVMFSINTTINALNIFHYRELVDWVQQYFPSNRLGDKVGLNYQNYFGTKFNASHLPECYRPLLEEIYGADSPICKAVSYSKTSDKFFEMLGHLSVMDNRRGTSYRDVFPYLSKVQTETKQ